MRLNKKNKTEITSSEWSDVKGVLYIFVIYGSLDNRAEIQRKGGRERDLSRDQTYRTLIHQDTHLIYFF